jgi:hypothetical protein
MAAMIEDESGTSPDVLFQLITLFVWAGAIVLLVLSAKHLRNGALDFPRLLMPGIHLIPWGIAVLERRRINKFLSNNEMPRHLSPPILRGLMGVLWSGYLVLTLVEYWLA